jgi:hypothetical protein
MARSAPKAELDTQSVVELITTGTTTQPAATKG